MNVFFALFGVVIGLLLNHLIIAPIERKKARKECIHKGLVPRDMT